jgi:D-threo-aldose 1-dehydrogenase
VTVSSLETIQLPASSTTTTRIGFGCSNLLGDKTREVGMSLLHAAYDSGVRHFDVARVYNFGDAEGLVGEFAADKRDKITITTKFGLMPRGNVAKMKGPVQLVRKLMRQSSFIRNLVRKNVSNLTQQGQFDPATAQISLETSLRALKTDYLDVYLLHEPSVTDCTDEIFAFLERIKAEGKIRAYGCGAGFDRVPAIVESRPEFLQVAQFESSLQYPHVEAFKASGPTRTLLTITHGSMGTGSVMKQYMASNPAIVEQWNQSVGIDLQAGANVYGLMLRQALHENDGGLVVFRAAAADRIRATLRAMEAVEYTAVQANALKAIAEKLPSQQAH